MAITFRQRLGNVYHALSTFGGPWDRSEVGNIKNVGSGNDFNPLRAVNEIPAAKACVRFLQSTLTRVEKRVVTTGEYPEDRPNHWLNVTLRTPHPTITPASLWRATGLDYWNRGAAYWVLTRSTKDPNRIVRIEVARLAGVRDGNPDDPDATFDMYVRAPASAGSHSVPVPQRDLCRFLDDEKHPIDSNDLNQRTPLTLSGKAHRTLKLYTAVLNRYENSQKHGLNSDLALTMDPDAMEGWAKRYAEEGSGNEYANVPLLLDTGTGIHQLKGSDRDRQTVEMGRFLIGEISRIYGVPLFVLQSDQASGAGNRSARNEVGEQFLHFISGDFGTTCQAFADEINLKFLGPSRQVEVMFDTEMLTLGSLETRANVANQLVQRTGIWTPNYARKRLFGLPPEKDGDMLRVPTGGTPPKEADGEQPDMDPESEPDGNDS